MNLSCQFAESLFAPCPAPLAPAKIRAMRRAKSHARRGMVHEPLLRSTDFGPNTQLNPWAATLISDTDRFDLWKCRVHNRPNTHQLQSTCGLAPRCSRASQPVCFPREAAHERREDPRCHEGSHVPQYAIKDVSQYADAPLRKVQDECLAPNFLYVQPWTAKPAP